MISSIIFFTPFLFLSVFLTPNQEEEIEISAQFNQPEIEIISIYDNYKVNEALKTDWGFASLIKTPEEQVLFDTGGNSEILLSNMEKLDIDPKSIDKIFLSHIHKDHTGGLEGLLDENNKVMVYAPKSFPDKFKEMVQGKGAELTEIYGAMKITDFAYSTGELSGPPAEQAIILDSKKGIIVMTGCAHPGIVKIIKQAKKVMNKDQVFMVLGGFHRPPKAAVQEFRKINVQKTAPSHCTGGKVIKAFKEEYKNACFEYGAGKRIVIK